MLVPFISVQIRRVISCFCTYCSCPEYMSLGLQTIETISWARKHGIPVGCGERYGSTACLMLQLNNRRPDGALQVMWTQHGQADPEKGEIALVRCC